MKRIPTEHSRLYLWFFTSPTVDKIMLGIGLAAAVLLVLLHVLLLVFFVMICCGHGAEIGWR
jgi:hypothetical protein